VARDFKSFLLCSLDVLEREKPATFARLCNMLNGKELELVVDDTPVVLRFTPAVRVEPQPRAPHIRLLADRSAILDVIDGLSLEDAIVAERITLAGSLDDLVSFHDALSAYLHGAVRAPSFPGLLYAYRRVEGHAPIQEELRGYYEGGSKET
jgi:hypothetical protein